eukprot:SM000058S18494  [mRNA]  locus=s58:272319:275648:+ [translate_table: standard]
MAEAALARLAAPGCSGLGSAPRAPPLGHGVSSWQPARSSCSSGLAGGHSFRAAPRLAEPTRHPRALLGAHATAAALTLAPAAQASVNFVPPLDGQILVGVEECPDGSTIYKYGLASAKLEEKARSLEDFLARHHSNGKASETALAGSTMSSGVSAEQEEEPSHASEKVEEGTSIDGVDGVDGSASSSSGGGDGEPGSNGHEELLTGSLRLESGAVTLPHPAKVTRGGEDAFFIEGDCWVGVADGVSTWAELGVNSGLYSRELMWNCGVVAREGELGFDPRSVIAESHSRTDLLGSCTVCVAALDGRTLRVANIGDSGFVIVRGGAVVTKSAQMTHSFNFPFQIGTNNADDPSAAQMYDIELEVGDVVLVGTDGFFDNVFDEQLATTVTQALEAGKDAEYLAKKLSQMAQKHSNMTSGSSPFGDTAKAVGYKFEGGKPDDITVVVSYVV